MKIFARSLSFLMLSIFLFVTPQSSVAGGKDKETIAAKKTVEDYFKALNEGQLETIAGLYHKDSVFLPKNAPAVRGIEAIRKAYQAVFEKVKLNTDHVYHHVAVYGKVAIVESHGTGTMTVLEGNKATQKSSAYKSNFAGVTKI